MFRRAKSDRREVLGHFEHGMHEKSRLAWSQDYLARATNLLATFRRKNSGAGALIPEAAEPGRCKGERVRV